MTKPFNIHDWQAKQRLNLLNEQDAFGSAGSDKRSGQIIGDILQLIRSTGVDPMDVMDSIATEFDINFDFNGGAPGMTKYGDKMPGPGRGLEEHHGDDFPKGLLDKKVSSFLDDLKKKSETDYDTIEDIMKKHFTMDEMSTTGTGASFSAGKGMGHFGGKKKSTKSGYMGYSQPAKVKK